MKLSRRNFLRGTVGAVAVTVAGPLLPKEAQAKLFDQPDSYVTPEEADSYLQERLAAIPARIRWTLLYNPPRKTYLLSGDILAWSPGDQVMEKLDEYLEHGTVDGQRVEGISPGILGDEVVFNAHLNATQEIRSQNDLLIQFAQRAIRDALADAARPEMWGELALNPLHGATFIRHWHE